MIQISIDEALVTREAVKAIYYTNYAKDIPPNSLVERRLPLGLKYRLTKVKNSFESELVLFDSERERLIRKFGTEIEKEDADGNKSTMIEVQDDKIIVLVETAERSDEIDLERAKAALGRAEAALKKLSPEDKQFKIYEAALERALIRMQVAAKAARK